MVIYTLPHPYIIFTSRLHSNPNIKKTRLDWEMWSTSFKNLPVPADPPLRSLLYSKPQQDYTWRSGPTATERGMIISLQLQEHLPNCVKQQWATSRIQNRTKSKCRHEPSSHTPRLPYTGLFTEESYTTPAVDMTVSAGAAWKRTSRVGL